MPIVGSRSPGIEPPVGNQGGKAPKLKAFCPFSYKGGPKVKDLSDNSPHVRHRLLLAAMTSPSFWSMEGGRPVCPCLDLPLGLMW